MNRLKQLRKEHHDTQLSLALELDVSSSTIKQYEGDERIQKSIEILSKIADYYGVSIDYLVGRTAVRDAATDEDLQLAYRIRHLHSEKARAALASLVGELELGGGPSEKQSPTKE